MAKLNGSLETYHSLEQRSGQILDKDIYQGGSKLFFTSIAIPRPHFLLKDYNA